MGAKWQFKYAVSAQSKPKQNDKAEHFQYAVKRENGTPC